MPDPRFDGIEAVGLDVEETKKMWSTYKEYVAPWLPRCYICHRTTPCEAISCKLWLTV